MTAVKTALLEARHLLLPTPDAQRQRHAAACV
jgi:hypothetical protein